MRDVECFFDCSSPWTYLGFHNLIALRDELGMRIVWRPILVGGVFNSVNDSVYRFRENPIPAKDAYIGKDMMDWARISGLRILWRPSIFPISTVRAMRACLVADDAGRLEPFARRIFELYWSEDRDIREDDALLDAAGAAALDGRLLLKGIDDPAIKQRLRANTDELVERGGFGSPTMFVGRDDMYFGNDRVELVRHALLCS